MAHNFACRPLEKTEYHTVLSFLPCCNSNVMQVTATETLLTCFWEIVGSIFSRNKDYPEFPLISA